MTQAPDIERIVQEVLRQLRPSPPPEAARDETKTKQDAHELALGDRVVSVAQLESRLEGVRRVRVGSRAIVTPAAHDLLRDRKVTLTRCDRTEKNGTPQMLLIGVAETAFEPAGVLGTNIEKIAKTGLENVVAELTAEVAGKGRRGVLFTNKRHAALCLANERAGVRAVWASNVADYQDAAKQIAVNLLVLDPARTSGFEMRRIVESFQGTTT